ncbi:protein of unknown function [Tistlia consotensis]|uniref:eCIS core domain-containing protein n=1 Tax=Tistlia consotensis USBA 355 TaxID=560819 RepID=A0A1Y6BCU4_9PROT|nr:DUF4157 domain-containing protein [Tistlia consotensis]SMF03145.1 protein of unknown function [Tistlia consotensis USBA 355]SNR53487.1 protein of unknown function [Tistlia consotensis]
MTGPAKEAPAKAAATGPAGRHSEPEALRQGQTGPGGLSNQMMQSVAAAGTPLDPAIRRQSEARLGISLAAVRLHTDAAADAFARRLRARAVTDGRHIAFRSDVQAGGTPDRTILAHELVHVAQRARSADTPSSSPVGRRRDADEIEARDLAGQVFSPGPVLAPRARPSAGLQRDDGPETTGDSTDSQERPLADLVAPDAEYQAEDPWELVYNIFRNHGSGQLAGMMIRRLIARRWYDAHGIDPATEMVEIATETPPGPTVLPARRTYRIQGHEITVTGEQITLQALAEAFGASDLEQLAAEASDEANKVGEAAALQAQAEALGERVPRFATRVRGSFADARLAEVEGFKSQVEQARDQARRLSNQAPASAFVSGLDGTLDGYVTTLAGVLSDLQTWRREHPRDVTSSEQAERRTTQALDAQSEMLAEGNYMAAGAWGESANANAMSMALIDLFGGRTQRDIAEAYDRGEVSYNEMEDLQYCAAVRTAVIGVVTVALTVATAGIGGAVVGGLGLATEGTLAFSALSLGVEGGLVNVGVMGSEHFLTSQRDFANPAAQAIWGRGAYTPEQYLEGFGMGFGMGAGFGAGGHFLFPPPAAGGGVTLLERGAAADAPIVLAGESPLARLGMPEPGRTPFDVLYTIDDAASGARTVALRMADGELVTIVGHAESGTGYLLRGNGEMYSIVDGQLAGRTRGLLGPGGGSTAAASAAEPPMVIEGPGGPIRLPGRPAEPQLPGVPQLPELPAGGYQPQPPEVAMQLWGDPRWAEYGGNWTMRDAATGQRMQVWQIDELMAAERRGALPGETQVHYQLPGEETFSGRSAPQSEVIPDIARTGRLGPMPDEGAVLTEVKHRDFTLPGLGRMQAMDAAGSLQRMYRAAGIEAQINPAAAGATLEVVTSQSLSAETHNLIVREFVRWLQGQGLTNTEIMEVVERIHWSTQRPYQIRGGTVIREP